ncbi:MAG: hypothetical protein EA361_13265 [Bacteroidetes bacterium]|nr:MAG: hypothetical protein EA361_13265 [Bacteroidota bacterium]
MYNALSGPGYIPVTSRSETNLKSFHISRMMDYPTPSSHLLKLVQQYGRHAVHAGKGKPWFDFAHHMLFARVFEGCQLQQLFPILIQLKLLPQLAL